MSKTPINIHIQTLIGKLVIVNTNKEETAEEIVEKITESLSKVIKSSQENPL